MVSASKPGPEPGFLERRISLGHARTPDHGNFKKTGNLEATDLSHQSPTASKNRELGDESKTMPSPSYSPAGIGEERGEERGKGFRRERKRWGEGWQVGCS